MFLTKFVEDAYLEETLNGRLKFGTLQEYRAIERQGEHRLTDSEEGQWDVFVKGPVVDATFNTKHNRFVNCTFTGSRAINITKKVNCYIFCASRSGYSEIRHLALLEHNPSLTSYVVFDIGTFIDGLMEVQSGLFGQWPNAVIGDFVEYINGGRGTETTPANIVQAENAVSAHQLVFSKPGRFVHEREIRFAFGPRQRCPAQPVFVRDLPIPVSKQFRRAVVSYGHLDA